MAKKKHLRYNPETLEYEEDLKSKKSKYFTILSILLSALVVYGLLFIASSYVAETPTQRKLNRENKLLEQYYQALSKRKKQTDAVLAELSEKDKNIYRAIFETEPEVDSMLAYNPYDKFETTEISAFPSINSKKLKQHIHELAEQEKSINIIKQLINKNKEQLKYIPSIKPLKATNVEYSVYGYGKRIDPVYKSPVFHSGIDFSAPAGTKVYATADGKVTHSGEKRSHSARGMGKQIRIKHGSSYTTVYAHLNSIKVRNGKRVKRGDLIGTVGNTGKSFVPHLHYEVILNGKQVNPINYFFIDLTAEQYDELHKESLRGGLSLD